MIYEVRYYDESVASAFVEASSPEEAERAFEELRQRDAGWLRDNLYEQTDAGNFVVDHVEEDGHDIDPAGLLAAFDRWKARIDEVRDAGGQVPREREAFVAGEALISLRHPACRILAEARGDFLDSSAEVAAFAFAMEELGYV